MALRKISVNYVYLQMTIVQGEFEHEHRVLFVTECKNIKFACMRYISRYWGTARRYKKFSNDVWLNSDMIVKKFSYINLNPRQYTTIRNIMYY
jgi:hypothetical protein